METVLDLREKQQSNTEGLERKETNLDQAVDMLATVLRDFGSYAFDLSDMDASEVSAHYDAWAQHVLYATPPPDKSSSALPQNGIRDWVGLHRFVHTHRRREHDYIVSTISGIRELVPQTLSGLQEVLSGSLTADREIQGHMKTLKSAAQEGSVELLRKEAFQTVSAVGNIIEAQQRQHSQQIEALQSQLKDMSQQLKQARAESNTDPLTRLLNRKAFDVHLEQTLELFIGFQTPACLVLIDADHFKRINDTFGHAAGDHVLMALSDCLARTFISQDDCVARYGGEEFAVILRDVTEQEACKLIDRFMARVRSMQVEAEENTIQFTVSAGIASLMPHEDAAGWLSRADDALYRAKQTGRDRYLTAG